jgi:hypothetical protein
MQRTSVQVLLMHVEPFAHGTPSQVSGTHAPLRQTEPSPQLTPMQLRSVHDCS